MNPSYTFTTEQIQTLNAALLEIPGKFGFPIIQLMNRMLAEQTKPAIVEAPKAEAVNE
jgi:hypothetical protein